MPWPHDSGTIDISLDTETDLKTGSGEYTDDGWFYAFVEIHELAIGDKLTFRAYTKCNSGGTERLLEEVVADHAQYEKFIPSGPWPSHVGIRFSIEQTDGTARDFPWKVYFWPAPA